jgi:hypothetical protein
VQKDFCNKIGTQLPRGDATACPYPADADEREGFICERDPRRTLPDGTPKPLHPVMIGDYPAAGVRGCRAAAAAPVTKAEAPWQDAPL